MSESQTATAAFDRTVSDLKSGVTSATTVYRDMSDKAAKTTNEAVNFHQGTLEAYSQASQLMAHGAQEMFRLWTASSRQAVQESLTGMRALMGVKSAREAIELQATIARSAAAWAISESGRFAHAGLELAEKASAPLTARAIVAAEKAATLKG